jgi:ADP-heptose:LPS heptosyltransferase
VNAVGTKRILDQFKEYFARIESLDGRPWLYLFSDSRRGRHWETIALVGKDRQGLLRQRLRQLTTDLIFIDMYPDEEKVRVEEHQLRQLRALGIEPHRKELPSSGCSRVVLYPEKPYRKEKWPVGNFAELARVLKRQQVSTVLVGSREEPSQAADVRFPEHLDDVAVFFSSGGFFVSNDSGMAHFAARCGLRTITIFREADPAVWGPKNGLTLDCRDKAPTIAEIAEVVISAVRGASGS